ncbi:MAG: class I SAM-dependent methyltransferase [Acidimicrobiia bacterium]|nr:class I SAM-dependent methyltransferase [Acidimicrobiia bacterium]MCY4433203.1 class I SAM-dependent methyltransferase [bacterium]
MDEVARMKQAPDGPRSSRVLAPAIKSWGSSDQVSLYLDRCQVDTPQSLVDAAWHQVGLRRDLGCLDVVDFGAGDGRFALTGAYRTYLGFEVDRSKFRDVDLPANASIENACAFSSRRRDFGACIGNPPYVRNQDLPPGWRHAAAEVVEQRTGVVMSGLANAWQYFTFLALSSTSPDGICALVIPYEWVSRPSSEPLRRYVLENDWDVSVYRWDDGVFDGVQTTVSLTVIDKHERARGSWSYFVDVEGSSDERSTPTSSDAGVLAYTSARGHSLGLPFAKRGLSPGTQKALVLTEGQRARHGLRRGTDVVPCVTSLRGISTGTTALSGSVFNRHFVQAGQRCWLPRTDRTPSNRLSAYLNSVPVELYQTMTCLARNKWWRFDMPSVPVALIASSFKKDAPKCVDNLIQARAVGSVCGIYEADEHDLVELRSLLCDPGLPERIVPHANGMRKLEIGQINTLLLLAREVRGGLK